MAAALTPTTSLRLKPFSAIRFLSFYHQKTPIPTTNLPFLPKTLATTSVFRPKFLIPSHAPTIPDRRCFCTATEVSAEKTDEQVGEKIGEFRKRASIVDIKGGPEEGVDKLGQDLTVRGWVRTVRVQSSVTFIEVNDGSCLSNMQCVMSSDAEGFDQVVMQRCLLKEETK